MTFPTGPYGWTPPPPPKPGVIPLAPLGLGEILGGAFATLGRHWKQLLAVALVAYGGAALLLGATLAIAYAAVADHLPRVFDPPPGQGPSWEDGQPLLIALAAVWAVGIVALLLANAVLYAACPAVLQDAVLGRPTTFGVVWGRAWKRMPAVLGTVFLTALIILVPIALFWIGIVGVVVAMIAAASDAFTSSPALPLLAMFGALLVAPVSTWLWVRYSLAPAAAVFEGQGALAAMGRSADLVRGAWWRIFGITLLAGLLAGLVSLVCYVIQQVLSLLISVPGASFDEVDSGGEAVAAFSVLFVMILLAQLVSQIVAATFPQLVAGLLYVDQRIRKENLAPTLAEAAAVQAVPVSR
ncbi:oxidoreductase [Streptomyces purpureus]|nr:oxidoreductase [Streptomyces purpureus]